jgi:hypothetical protein
VQHEQRQHGGNDTVDNYQDGSVDISYGLSTLVIDDDLRLRIADARPVDTSEDEADALFMIESEKDRVEQMFIYGHLEEPAIVSEDGRLEKLSPDARSSLSTSIAPPRPSFKPYRCPHCFYRTNWHTDCLRRIGTRYNIKPSSNVNYEMPPEEAERTYDDYERPRRKNTVRIRP